MSEAEKLPQVEAPMIKFGGLVAVDASDVPRPKRKYERSAWAGDAETVLLERAAKLMAAYKLDALDALHELATMDISDNSAQNMVKFTAAKLLAQLNELPKAPEEGGIAGTLKALNEKFHKDAPRIRSIRRETVEFENGAQAIDVTPGA